MSLGLAEVYGFLLSTQRKEYPDDSASAQTILDIVVVLGT